MTLQEIQLRLSNLPGYYTVSGDILTATAYNAIVSRFVADPSSWTDQETYLVLSEVARLYYSNFMQSNQKEYAAQFLNESTRYKNLASSSGVTAAGQSTPTPSGPTQVTAEQIFNLVKNMFESTGGTITISIDDSGNRLDLASSGVSLPTYLKSISVNGNTVTYVNVVDGVESAGRTFDLEMGNFDGNYNSLTNKPTLFDGSYNSLTNKPTINNSQVTQATVYAQVKEILKQGNNITINEDDSDYELTLNGQPGGTNYTLTAGKIREVMPRAGTFSADDETHLDGIEAEAQKNVHVAAASYNGSQAPANHSEYIPYTDREGTTVATLSSFNWDDVKRVKINRYGGDTDPTDPNADIDAEDLQPFYQRMIQEGTSEVFIQEYDSNFALITTSDITLLFEPISYSSNVLDCYVYKVKGEIATADTPSFHLSYRLPARYLRKLPESGDTNVQSDWNETDSAADDFIKNKPTLFDGNYNSLTNKPTIPAAQIQSDWDQTTTTAKDFIKNKPTIPAAQVQADWNTTTTTAKSYIKNKPDLSKHVQVDDVIPFIPDDSLDVNWVSSISGETYKEGVISSGNPAPSGQPSDITDAVVIEWPISATDETTRRAILAKYLGTHPIIRGVSNSKFVIARSVLVEENSTAKATYFWFNPSTDESETLSYDQLPNGTGTFDIMHERMQTDGGNADWGKFVDGLSKNVHDELRTAIQGINETTRLTGLFTRRANSAVVNEWYVSGTQIFINVETDSQNDTELNETTNITSWLEFGTWQIEPTGNISRSVVGTVATFTFNYETVTGTIPGLNISTYLDIEGADAHRGELTKTSFKEEVGTVANHYIKTTGASKDTATQAPLTAVPSTEGDPILITGGAVKKAFNDQGLPASVPANDSSEAKDYIIRVPQTSGAPTYEEAASGGGGGSSWVQVGSFTTEININTGNYVPVGSFTMSGSGKRYYEFLAKFAAKSNANNHSMSVYLSFSNTGAGAPSTISTDVNYARRSGAISASSGAFLGSTYETFVDYMEASDDYSIVSVNGSGTIWVVCRASDNQDYIKNVVIYARELVLP